MLLLDIVSLIAGFFAATWKRALLAAALATLVYLAWNVLILMYVSATTKVADPSGGLARATGYLLAETVFGAVKMTIAACIGHGLALLFRKRGKE